MTLFGQDAPNKPVVPDEKTRLMRVNTLAEEVGELAMASGVLLRMAAHPNWKEPMVEVTIIPEAVPDIAQVADALADAQYFVDGTANAYGLDLEPFFDEVHRANMDKMWAAVDLMHMEPGWSATQVVVPVEGTLVVTPQTKQFIVKRQDGKVMKPPGFQPPDLSKVMEAQKCLHSDGPPTSDLPTIDLDGGVERP